MAKYSSFKVVLVSFVFTCVGLGFMTAAIPVGAQVAKETKITRTGSSKNLKLESVKARKANGYLQVQVTLINDSSRTVEFNYRFRWLDEAGFKLAEESWQPARLFPGQSYDFEGIAGEVSATDFSIELNGMN